MRWARSLAAFGIKVTLIGLSLPDQKQYQDLSTTVFKFTTHTSTDTFEEYAEFPTGFIALCSVGYGGVVYVGGYYDGPNVDKGVGAIYACTDAGPALVASMGDQEEDWRVYAMAAYEKNLYYLSNGSVWRYDLVNGGYSHWSNVVTTGATGTISWDAVSANMTAEPTAPDWTVTEVGAPTSTVADGILTPGTGGTDSISYVRADSGIDSATGTTMEVILPASAVQGNWLYFYIDTGIRFSLAPRSAGLRSPAFSVKSV